jgi:hypothetical protein
MTEGGSKAIENRVPTAEELGFDPNELREEYIAERDKRTRADGNDQYREISGQFEHYKDDPYVESGFTRPALNERVDVVIIGGGFGGLVTPPVRPAQQIARIVDLLVSTLARQLVVLS